MPANSCCKIIFWGWTITVKTYSFSHLQKALLAAGSFSCLGLSLSPVWVHAANENEISQLEKLTVIAQMTYDQPEVN